MVAGVLENVPGVFGVPGIEEVLRVLENVSGFHVDW